jgi:glycosyltransferase involved in cell wall biosynthesis
MGNQLSQNLRPPLTTKQYPNVVLISQEIPHLGAAGSILLFRLFSEWPADRLIVYGPTPPASTETLRCEYHFFKPAVTRLQSTRFAPIAPPLSWVWPIAVPDVKVAAPTVVVSVMQSSAYYRAAHRFASERRLPLALIIHDDPEEIEPVRSWSRRLMRNFNGRAYRLAQIRFCISPQMRDELAIRYGAMGEVLYPNRSRSLSPRSPELNQSLRRPNNLVLGYAGSLNYGYGQRLQQLLPIFRRERVTLRIYSSHKPSFLAAGSVEYAGHMDPSHVWERVKTECDAVILPYCGPDLGHQDLYRTHFPSKLTEYLALNMPVVITGPKYATGVQWGAAHPQACITIVNGNFDNLATALQRLSSDASYRARLAQGAVDCANEQFDPRIIEETFRKKLCIVASKEFENGE